MFTQGDPGLASDIERTLTVLARRAATVGRISRIDTNFMAARAKKGYKSVGVRSLREMVERYYD